MGEYLLTIAIPTYNRLPFLKENLEVLLPQLEVEESVELIVSDNASEDGTEGYMTGLLREGIRNIQYIRNEVNKGADGNVLNCFRRAKGRYLLILSDDDILQKGALKVLLQIVGESPDFVFLNHGSFMGKYSKKCGSPLFNLKKDYYTQDRDDFFGKIGIHMTFLSALCYKMADVKRIQNMEQFRNTNFLQSYVALAVLAEPRMGKLCITAEPLVAVRGGNTGGYNLYTVWFENYHKWLLDAVAHYKINENVMKCVRYTSYRDTILEFVRIFRVQEKGLKLSHKSKVWGPIKYYPDLWLKTLFWVYMPDWGLAILKNVKHLLKTGFRKNKKDLSE